MHLDFISSLSQAVYYISLFSKTYLHIKIMGNIINYIEVELDLINI